MLEYMDHTSINAVEDLLHMGLDRDAAALIVARSDSWDEDAREVTIMTEACRRHDAIEVISTADEEEGELFVTARRMAIPAVEKLGRLLLEDVGVPLLRLPELVAGVEGIAAEQAVSVALIAHAGDGNTHPLIVFDPADPAQGARAQSAFGEIMELAIRLGGTITGEHGVGRLKRPWLESQVGSEVLELSGRIKSALDPLNILNPGAIFS
jgi:glycolate oxidase